MISVNCTLLPLLAVGVEDMMKKKKTTTFVPTIKVAYSSIDLLILKVLHSSEFY